MMKGRGFRPPRRMHAGEGCDPRAPSGGSKPGSGRGMHTESPLCLLTDPWFTRLWTALELCVSPRICVATTQEHVCGLGCITGARTSTGITSLQATADGATTGPHTRLLDMLNRSASGAAGDSAMLAGVCDSWAGQSNKGIQARPFKPASIMPRELAPCVLTTARLIERHQDYFNCAALLCSPIIASTGGHAAGRPPPRSAGAAAGILVKSGDRHVHRGTVCPGLDARRQAAMLPLRAHRGNSRAPLPPHRPVLRQA